MGTNAKETPAGLWDTVPGRGAAFGLSRFIGRSKLPGRAESEGRTLQGPAAKRLTQGTGTAVRSLIDPRFAVPFLGECRPPKPSRASSVGGRLPSSHLQPEGTLDPLHCDLRSWSLRETKTFSKQGRATCHLAPVDTTHFIYRKFKGNRDPVFYCAILRPLQPALLLSFPLITFPEANT